FDAAIKLRETYDQSKGSNVYQMPPEAADIVSSATHQKILLLKEQNDLKGAIAAANSFLSTTPDALNTTKGLAILVPLPEGCKDWGDKKGLESACKRLMAADPRGAGGERARELLGGGAQSTARNLGAADTLQLAYSMFGKDDLDRTIEICQRTLDLASGTPEE